MTCAYATSRVYDFIGSRTREADLVEEGAARRLVDRRERVHFREAVLAADRISPDERKHVRTAAGHERLGGEALLRVAEMVSSGFSITISIFL